MSVSLGPDDLIAAYYTLSGSAPNTPGRHPAADRIAAAAAAGYTAMGMHADDYERWGGLPELRKIADDHGVALAELEFLVNWSLDGDDAAASRLVEDQLYEMADAFGSRHLNVGIREGHGEMAPIEVAAERFAALCDRAARHDLTVAFEFMPFRELDTVARAWELVRTADRPNGAVLLDAWHWFRGTPDLALLDEVPAERIALIQLCDGHREPVGDLFADTLNHRLLPGQGVWDLSGLLAALRRRGVSAPVSVEILSGDLRSVPLGEAAVSTYKASRDLVPSGGGR